LIARKTKSSKQNFCYSNNKPRNKLIMLVGHFMTKASDVVTCSEWDPVLNVIDAVLDHNISAVVVNDKTHKPVGIITKTDLVRAYKNGVNLHQKVGVIMATNLRTILDTCSRDDAAKFLEKNRLHHAIIVDKEGNFAGIVSVWDVASEMAKDSRAWPWNRTVDGRVAPMMAGVH
jgi:CBS domain-containing protein